MNLNSLPELEGVQHQFVDLGGGVTIHVADAGPTDGAPVMLVHGIPQNWWEWHELIGPLAGDGYRVLCPDLRGAGWSSAPRDRYFKADMADDLAAVLDRLGVGPVRFVAHDWGGPVGILMMLRHPEKVRGFFGVNTVAPWMRMDLALVRHLWRFWFQYPMSAPILGPRVIGDPRAATGDLWLAGPVGDSCQQISISTSAGWERPVTPLPGRAGYARSKHARCGVGSGASMPRPGWSQSAGCTGWMTQ